MVCPKRVGIVGLDFHDAVGVDDSDLYLQEELLAYGGVGDPS